MALTAILDLALLQKLPAYFREAGFLIFYKRSIELKSIVKVC